MEIYAGGAGRAIPVWKGGLVRSVVRGGRELWRCHVVTFRDWDGSVVSRQYVCRGGSATPPAPPSRGGYAFRGWRAPGVESLRRVARDVELSACYEQLVPPGVITEVSYEAASEGIASRAQAAAVYQNRAYGYMQWTGRDLPAWQTDLSAVFLYNELGGALTSQSGTAKGYSGTTVGFADAGRGGITLSCLRPKFGSPALYTKVEVQPGIQVRAVTSGPADSIGMQSAWLYTDAPDTPYLAQRLGMPPTDNETAGGAVYAKPGYSAYTRGRYLRLDMDVADSDGTHTFSVSADAGYAYNKTPYWWHEGTLPPAVVTLDFGPALAAAGLKKDARTTELRFLESTGYAFTKAYPAAVNAVRVYKDGLNGLS